MALRRITETFCVGGDDVAGGTEGEIESGISSTAVVAVLRRFGVEVILR
jgi:hypothetical protein